MCSVTNLVPRAFLLKNGFFKGKALGTRLPGNLIQSVSLCKLHRLLCKANNNNIIVTLYCISSGDFYFVFHLALS